MRSPASLALALFLVAPLLACFSDGGRPVVSSAGATTGGSEPGMTGMTGEPDTAGTQASTDSTGAPTTGAPTTGAPSTGPTTGVVDECEPNAECQAGAVEDGALCDSCGVQRRTCQADCTWSPIACEQDLDTCAYWRLPTGAKEWQRFPVEPGSMNAPSEPVLGAFALAPQQRIYVLTANRYHILDAPTQTWLEAGPREDILPALAGKTFHHGTSFVQDPPNVIVTLVADSSAFAYTYVAGTGAFQLDAEVPCCGDNWVGANAPPDPLAVRAGWGHLGDAEGWIPGDVQALCPEHMADALYGYNLSIGDGFVYPQDIGYCFDFYAPIPFDQFLPFSYPGRPANDLIAGAAWVDGLWVFR